MCIAYYTCVLLEMPIVFGIGYTQAAQQAIHVPGQACPCSACTRFAHALASAAKHRDLKGQWRRKWPCIWYGIYARMANFSRSTLDWLLLCGQAGQAGAHLSCLALPLTPLCVTRCLLRPALLSCHCLIHFVLMRSTYALAGCSHPRTHHPTLP